MGTITFCEISRKYILRNIMKIFGLITVQLTNAAVVRRQASFNRIFTGDYTMFADTEDLSTTEDFDESILLLETTPQPFDIFQTTGPVIDEIRSWTSGPDYPETTEGPFGAFTTEEIGFGYFTTGAPEIDLSTVMTFPTDAPSIFTTGSIFDFTTLPDLVTLGLTAPVTGLPSIPETTEFLPLETTPPPMIIDFFTTPFELTPTAPDWLFKTTASFDFPEITEDFTGLPFLTSPQPIITNSVEQPKQNPDAFDQDAFTNAIENAIKALENNSESDKTDENPTIIDDNSVAVLIPVPNKSTTSSPVITSTSTTTTSSSTTTSTTTNSSTIAISTTTTSSTLKSTSTATSTTTSSSMSPPDTTAVVEPFSLTTAADKSMITNSLTTETDVSSVVVDVTTPADLVLDLTTGDIDVTETPEVSNVTTPATTATPAATTAAAGSGFSITGLAITALFIILL